MGPQTLNLRATQINVDNGGDSGHPGGPGPPCSCRSLSSCQEILFGATEAFLPQEPLRVVVRCRGGRSTERKKGQRRSAGPQT